MAIITSVLALVNTSRVLRDLNELRTFGATHGGRYGRGVSRQALTEADLDARKWLASLMEEEGGLVGNGLDSLGTLLGKGGHYQSKPALLMGSHSDTQPEGGWLDGALGVVYAIEAARVFHEAGLADRGAQLSWAVIDWSDEEGRFAALTASHAFIDEQLPLPDVHAAMRATMRASTRYGDAMQLAETDEGHVWRRSNCGFEVAAYFEAHIEQGPRLERANATLGVVTSIVGMKQFQLDVIGVQSHAGATHMNDRADAGLKAMRAAVAIDAAIRRELCVAPGGGGTIEDVAAAAAFDCSKCDAVWTMSGLSGFVSHSTVPGAAILTIQFRAPTEATLSRITNILQATVGRLANEDDQKGTGLVLIEEIDPIPAAPMDPGLRACVRGACDAVAASSATTRGTNADTPFVLEFQSSAIHDASPLAAGRIPSAMLFVPSVDGVSHTFEEHTEDDDIAAGARAFVAAAAGMVMQQCDVH